MGRAVEAIMTYFKVFSWHLSMEELRKTTKYLCQDIQHSGQDMDSGLPK
jgi:hypothetical protein